MQKEDIRLSARPLLLICVARFAGGCDRGALSAASARFDPNSPVDNEDVSIRTLPELLRVQQSRLLH